MGYKLLRPTGSYQLQVYFDGFPNRPSLEGEAKQVFLFFIECNACLQFPSTNTVFVGIVSVHFHNIE